MQHTEKQLESQRIYDGKVVHLRVDTVELPSGRTSKREVLEHRGAVCILPVLPDGQIAMIRQWRTAAQEILWEIPAGGLEEGEVPEECAKRELIEEVGYTTGKISLLFQCYLAPGYSSEMMWAYLAEDLELVGAQPEEDETIELVIKPLEELLPLIDSGEIRDSKTICALLALHRQRGQK
ncbi:ADP-ribose pyrophosphatase [Abditibacterium utsteinense]|uniref:GDP-mannose pyrophosphatase n=1 Tax=Abditibacterium utsteinense TaxID=1960156 RepID=A0A2S8SS33_9BACT|nr:NUDIX hydrolase [Abditibacterium utsteinense]PQV63610.1 ADP-ribose pyrophosphatase [Abditibacterium utsteinense]